MTSKTLKQNQMLSQANSDSLNKSICFITEMEKVIVGHVMFFLFLQNCLPFYKALSVSDKLSIFQRRSCGFLAK